MARVHNFNAGPAAIPLPVLESAREELLDFESSGMSILEHSHRGKVYDDVHNEAIELLRELLEINDDYQVMFLQGGASMQFAMLPMNLLGPEQAADYIVTGTWGQKAFDEAKRLKLRFGVKPNVAVSTEEDGRYTSLPDMSEVELNPKAAYVHITSNNTVSGTQWHDFPDTKRVPLIADMSSDVLWRRFDVSKLGGFYAGAQKNVGPSGVAIVVLRRDLVNAVRSDIPNILSYRVHSDKNSLYHTPNTFGVMMIRNVLRHLKEKGMTIVERENRRKAAKLYEAIDAHGDFYTCPIPNKKHRSFMNVVFNLATPELEGQFVKEAADEGLVGLKGHRSVGGIRASIYNAATDDSVSALVSFMSDFQSRG